MSKPQCPVYVVSFLDPGIGKPKNFTFHKLSTARAFYNRMARVDRLVYAELIRQDGDGNEVTLRSTAEEPEGGAR